MLLQYIYDCFIWLFYLYYAKFMKKFNLVTQPHNNNQFLLYEIRLPSMHPNRTNEGSLIAPTTLAFPFVQIHIYCIPYALYSVTPP